MTDNRWVALCGGGGTRRDRRWRLQRAMRELFRDDRNAYYLDYGFRSLYTCPNCIREIYTVYCMSFIPQSCCLKKDNVTVLPIQKLSTLKCSTFLKWQNYRGLEPITGCPGTGDGIGRVCAHKEVAHVNSFVVGQGSSVSWLRWCSCE